MDEELLLAGVDMLVQAGIDGSEAASELLSAILDRVEGAAERVELFSRLKSSD